jgi:glycosyltransferase involved in cell wall biosynthesis
MVSLPQSLVVNFNSPELGQLARALAARGALTRYVRPYANKNRAWERALAALPLLGQAYASTFGRRRIDDPALAALTNEAGVAADVAAAALSRLRGLPSEFRAQHCYRLQESVRLAVAHAAAGLASAADCAVAYVGCGLPAFEALRTRGATRAVLSYPIAHHRFHRELQREEHARDPELGVTWPTLAEWPADYERQIDAEIEMADCILVGSTYVRDTFVREGVPAAKIAVAPYGVDLQTFGPAAQREARSDATFRAIFVGQLSQRKGIRYLLNAYRGFRKPDTELTLVGNVATSDAPLRPYANLFRHVPHQTRPALAQRYRESDVFVFPTLLEGMPLVVLEAMACGLPVIVTPNGPGDIVRDGIDGFIVPARDEAAIADRLERLYADPELRARMGRNASERAREFTWAAYSQHVFDVLAALADPRRMPNATPH